MSTKEELIGRIRANQDAARDKLAELERRFAIEDLLRENDAPVPTGSISLGVVLETRRYFVPTGDQRGVPRSGPCVVAIRVNGGKPISLRPYTKTGVKGEFYISMQQWAEMFGAQVVSKKRLEKSVRRYVVR